MLRCVGDVALERWPEQLRRLYTAQAGYIIHSTAFPQGLPECSRLEDRGTDQTSTCPGKCSVSSNLVLGRLTELGGGDGAQVLLNHPTLAFGYQDVPWVDSSPYFPTKHQLAAPAKFSQMDF